MMFWKNRCRYCWGDHRKVSLCAGAMVESLRAEVEALKFDAIRMQWIQDDCESLDLIDYTDDVQYGRVWVVNDDEFGTDNLRDAIDAAAVAGEDE
jgi:hypothetical protein